jgi:glycosyltransferase involved in cell wall biosynthesis
MSSANQILAGVPADHQTFSYGSAKLPRLSVIVPTFNERDNVRELVARLDRCLAGLDWEVMFVDDDSRDGTLFCIASAGAAWPPLSSKVSSPPFPRWSRCWTAIYSTTKLCCLRC